MAAGEQTGPCCLHSSQLFIACLCLHGSVALPPCPFTRARVNMPVQIAITQRLWQPCTPSLSFPSSPEPPHSTPPFRPRSLSEWESIQTHATFKWMPKNSRRTLIPWKHIFSVKWHYYSLVKPYITSIYNAPFTLSSAFNVIPCTSLLFSLHLGVHQARRSTCVCTVTVRRFFQDSQISYQQITKKKETRDTQHLFIPFFLFHPFVIWFLYSSLGLVPLWSLGGCCLACAPCLFSESTELLQLLSAAFIQCCFTLFRFCVVVCGLIVEVIKLIVRLRWLICCSWNTLLWYFSGIFWIREYICIETDIVTLKLHNNGYHSC